MKYNPKNKAKYSDNLTQSQDLETLLRYQRRGIKLTFAQEQIIKSSGIYEETTQQKQDRCSRQAISEMNSAQGMDAVKGGYYTELFQHFYKQALSGEILHAPYPIPQGWVDLGKMRIESGKTDYKVHGEKLVEGAVHHEKTALDFEIERQLATK